MLALSCHLIALNSRLNRNNKPQASKTRPVSRIRQVSIVQVREIYTSASMAL